jgi:hypothetical protein
MRIRDCLLSGAILLCLTMTSSLAEVLPLNRPYPEFQIGVTGIWAKITNPPSKPPKDAPPVKRELVVTKTTENTPAAGKFQAGDVLLRVNGKSLEIQDPRPVLGKAIGRVEGFDGKMTFRIMRKTKQTSVTIKLRTIGSYSKTWPENCKKSKAIVDETIAFLLKNELKHSINGYLEALFLLATGDDKHLPLVKTFAYDDITRHVSTRGLSNWGNGYRGIFLAEYYLRTGDKKVLPKLQELCDVASAGQYYGGWAHGPIAGPGYVTGGHVHAAGEGVLISLFLARECGIDVNERSYDRALTLFYRYAGHGTVPYGDHHPTMFWSDNGKNAMLACALRLLPGKKFQGASQVLALSVTDSYDMCEGGHGSSFTNHLWHCITDVLVIDTFPNHYRRHKDKKGWYYDLARLPGGGFKSPPSWGNSLGPAPTYQTGLLAFAYMSYKKQLRINGKPRTKHSVKHKPTKVEQELPYTDAHIPGFCPGGGDKGLDPQEIRDIFMFTYDENGNRLPRAATPWVPSDKTKKMPLSWYATMMRHYTPDVRTWAAHYVGYAGQDAIPEILKALKSDDDRVRVAGLEAISGVLFWGVAFTKLNITPEMIDKHFLPYIIGPLKDPKAPMWEKRHALMALTVASKETVKKNLSVIEPYFYDDEWWLRVAAYASVSSLIDEGDALRPVLKSMTKSLATDVNLPSRRWGATRLLKQICNRNDVLRAEVIQLAGRAVAAMPLRGKMCIDLKAPAKDHATEVRSLVTENLRRIDSNNIFEMLRYIGMQNNPKHAILFLPAIESVYSDLSGQHAGWVFTGARWGNIGYLKIAEKLGKDAAPVIASMKRLLPDVKKRAKSRDSKLFQGILKSAEKTIQDYEKKYGAVEP